MTTDVMLNTRQRKAITALLSCSTVADAAERSGVAERTLYRWLQDPAFRLRLSEAETEAISASVRRLVALQTKALDTIEAILDSPTVRATTQLRAAALVLDTTIRLRELTVIEQRLAQLEAKYHEA